MKNTFKSLLALLLMTSICTSCSSKQDDATGNEEEEIQEMEIEEEFDVQTEEGEVGGGL